MEIRPAETAGVLAGVHVLEEMLESASFLNIGDEAFQEMYTEAEIKDITAEQLRVWSNMYIAQVLMRAAEGYFLQAVQVPEP